MQYLFTYSKTSHHLFFSSVSCNIAFVFVFVFLVLCFILLNMQISSNFSCGEITSLYTLSLLVCVSYPFYTLKPISLKKSSRFSVSSFSSNFWAHSRELPLHHFTKTVLIKVINQLHAAEDAGQFSFLISTDFSAAFVTINHSLLFNADASLSLQHNTFCCFFSTFLVSSQCFTE